MRVTASRPSASFSKMTDRVVRVARHDQLLLRRDREKRQHVAGRRGRDQALLRVDAARVALVIRPPRKPARWGHPRIPSCARAGSARSPSPAPLFCQRMTALCSDMTAPWQLRRLAPCSYDADSAVAVSPMPVPSAAIFGSVALLPGEPPVVCRDTAAARWWARPASRWLARREARALQALAGDVAFPALLRWDGRRLLRSSIPGATMRETRPRDPGLLQAGVARACRACTIAEWRTMISPASRTGS